jgi:hypothetical protein
MKPSIALMKAINRALDGIPPSPAGDDPGRARAQPCLPTSARLRQSLLFPFSQARRRRDPPGPPETTRFRADDRYNQTGQIKRDDPATSRRPRNKAAYLHIGRGHAVAVHRTSAWQMKAINRALDGILILAAFRFQNLFSTSKALCTSELTMLGRRRLTTYHSQSLARRSAHSSSASGVKFVLSTVALSGVCVPAGFAAVVPGATIRQARPARAKWFDGGREAGRETT